MKGVWDWNHCGYDLFYWSLELFGLLLAIQLFCLGGVDFGGGASLAFLGI